MKNWVSNIVIAEFLGLKFAWRADFHDVGDEFNYNFELRPKAIIYLESEKALMEEHNWEVKSSPKHITPHYHQGKYYFLMHPDLEEEYQEHLKFDSDWNKLMFVVEKIEEHGAKTLIGTKSCAIYPSGDYKDEAHIVLKTDNVTKHNLVYCAALEYIYNYGNKTS
jgi:hypothetical protein